MTVIAETGDGLWSARHRSLTTGLVLTFTLVAVEGLAISTVMPIVARDLGGLELYGWVFSAFFLSSLIGIVVVGGLIDRVGPAIPFVGGLAIFGLGLLLGGLAPSMPVLVLARFLQGFGGGSIAPTAYSAIGRSLPPSLRPTMFALAATAWVVPGLIGPAIAGVVAEQVGWRIVFVGVLPFIGIALALTLPSLVKLGTPPAESFAGPTSLRRLPVAVAVSIAAGLVLAGLSSESLVLFAVLVPLGLIIGIPAFARLTPPGTLTARRGLPAAVLIRGFLTFAFFAVYPYIPFALIDWRGLSASEAGIVLTAATLSWSAAAWVAARLVPRWGEAPPIRLGFAILVIGLTASLAVLVPGVPPLLGALTFGVAGFGIGTAYSPISLTVLSSAAPGEVGSATAGLQLSDVLGQSLGPGVSGALLAASIRAGVASGWALAVAFGLAVVVGIAGLILTSRLAGRARRPVDVVEPMEGPEGALAAAVSVGPADTVR